MYIGFSFDKNKFSFSTGERTQDKGLALTTLNKIEQTLLLKKGQLFLEDLPEVMNKSKYIRDSYLAKTKNMLWIKRFFGRVAKKEQAINSAYDRIENLIYPPPALGGLPKDMILHISSFLPTSDLEKLDQVNKSAKIYVDQAKIKRAQEYGYKGENLNEARDYLKNLFQSVKILVEDEDNEILKKFTVYRGQFINPEATFRKLKQQAISCEESTTQLYRALLLYAKKGKFEIVRLLLLLLKVDPKKYAVEGGKALYLTLVGSAVIENPKDVEETVKLLVEAGADVNVPDSHGHLPLHWAAYNGYTKIAEFLLSYNTRINEKGQAGNTPRAI